MKIAPSQMRILIADDQPDVLEALRLLLKREGYKIEAVESPQQALQCIENRDFDAGDHRSELYTRYYLGSGRFGFAGQNSVLSTPCCRSL